MPSGLERVRDVILTIRGQRVIVDADLARLYGVQTKRLNEQVRRNQRRFPEDFMFSLTLEEKEELVANCDQFKNLKHSSSLPLAFTEHGAVMAANVLNSSIAIEMSILVVRAFILSREIFSKHQELKRRLDSLERRVTGGFQANEEELQALRFWIGHYSSSRSRVRRSKTFARISCSFVDAHWLIRLEARPSFSIAARASGSL